MKADTPIELASLKQMTDQEIDILLEQIRERRLKPVRDYEEMLALKDEARAELLGKQYDRVMEMFEKELERVDKALFKLESRAIKIRALRLEMGA